MNYNVLQKNIDLFQIYKEGEINTVKYYFENYDHIYDRWHTLIQYYMKFFPEVFEYPRQETNKEIIENRSLIYEDEFFEEFKVLYEMVGKGEKGDIDSCVTFPDEIGQKFYEEYFGRPIKHISIKTTMDEALASGIKEIIEVKKLEQKRQELDKEFMLKLDEQRREEFNKASKDNMLKSGIYPYDIMNKLEDLLNEYNMTFGELAEKVGLDLSVIQLTPLATIANQLVKMCSAFYLDNYIKNKEAEIQKLKNICELFNVPYDYFYYNSEKKGDLVQ